MSYVDMVGDLLLGLLRSSREGDWALHMSTIYAMIPWCFAYDKVNYARYLPVYYADMSNISTQYPDIYNNFLDGRFSVQLGSDNPFGKIPVDQTTEETVNKDTKTSGGVRKYSLNANAVSRFYLTAEYRSAYLHQFRNMVGMIKSGLHHAELQKPRILKDEAAVTSVVETLDNWNNPFSEDAQDIVSLSTSIAATPDISNDLLKAHTYGEQSFQKFREDRLEKETPTVRFHDPIKKHKLKTFSDLTKKTKHTTVNGKEIILKADRKLFGQMILIAQTRKDLSMKEVLRHPLGPLPWSLATPEGRLRKINKAVLAKELQKSVNFAEEIPQPSATIIDGMALVQKIKGDQKTFGQVALSILSSALREGRQSNRIDVVFDVYRARSIKSTERIIRGAESSVQFKSITTNQIVRQWRKFLASTGNKASLIEFIVYEWMKPESTALLADKQLYVTCEQKCYLITTHGSEEVPQLASSHEEADTRLLFHAAHAAECHYKAIIMVAEDTDVFLLCLAFNDNIQSSLYQKHKSNTRTCFIDIGKVAAVNGPDMCNAILGVHAFTGCDSVSSLAGKGKIAAVRLLRKNRAMREIFVKLGENWELSETTYNSLESFTCALYGCKDDCADINSVRYNLFCSKKGEIESHQLPPCKDSLHKHIDRANYQAGIWRRALIGNPAIPDPVGHGWLTESVDNPDTLGIDWMNGDPAPEAVMELLSCKCPRSCTLPKCTCLANGMKCSDMCKLTTCQNQPNDDEDEDVDLASDDDVDEYDY